MAKGIAKGSRYQEEHYFQERERALIEKLRQRAEQRATLLEMSARTGVVDEEVLTDLIALGYTPDTCMPLHLLPLVRIAWADGDVSNRERDLILDLACARGITRDSAAGRQLDEWLSHRPPATLFDVSMRAVVLLLQAAPSPERSAGERNLVSCCLAVAEASGGILGLGRVSREERETLTRIAAEFERGRAAAVQDTLDSLVGPT
jgi:hypothetical protein